MNLTEQELQKLQSATSGEHWNQLCEEVKAARDGEYPPDWYARVILSGLMARVTAGF